MSLTLSLTVHTNKSRRFLPSNPYANFNYIIKCRSHSSKVKSQSLLVIAVFYFHTILKNKSRSSLRVTLGKIKLEVDLMMIQTALKILRRQSTALKFLRARACSILRWTFSSLKRRGSCCTDVLEYFKRILAHTRR